MNQAASNFSLKINYSTSLTDQSIIQPTRQATFIGAILAFVFIFCGLIGNILVITTILTVKKLRTNIINIFIVSVRYDLVFRKVPFSVLGDKKEAGGESNKQEEHIQEIIFTYSSII